MSYNPFGDEQRGRTQKNMSGDVKAGYNPFSGDPTQAGNSNPQQVESGSNPDITISTGHLASSSDTLPVPISPRGGDRSRSPSPSPYGSPSSESMFEPPSLHLKGFQLRVVGHEIMKTKDPYVLYHIEVSLDGVTQIVKKRFRHLLEFHNKLGIKGIKAPPKHGMALKATGKKNDFIEKRKKEIQVYLSELSNQPRISHMKAVSNFFDLGTLEDKKDDEFQIAIQKIQELEEDLDTTLEAKNEAEHSLAEVTTIKDRLSQQLEEMTNAFTKSSEQNERYRKEVEILKVKLAAKEHEVDDILSRLKILLAEHGWTTQ